MQSLEAQTNKKNPDHLDKVNWFKSDCGIPSYLTKNTAKNLSIAYFINILPLSSISSEVDEVQIIWTLIIQT